METKDQTDRVSAIHLMRSGKKPSEVAADLGRSQAWVYKWQARFKNEGWSGVKARSRAPKASPRRHPERVWEAVRAARSQLEAEAEQPGNLTYIGAHAVRARLRRNRLRPLPSISSIERELRRAGMSRPKQALNPAETLYPHLSPRQCGQLIQVDIQPHYLPGGTRLACFNALDVVSRYPTGQQFTRKRSQEATVFLVHVWQEIGLAQYTQTDNESCFSGGFTHPYVLGRLVRLGLYVGTEVVFSPFYHPKSNAYVERFHQDYDQHVWQAYDLPDLAAVRRHSPTFFRAYRTSQHHSALNGLSPAQCHRASSIPTLAANFQLPSTLPLTAGQVHFIRKVEAQGYIRVLNVDWPVPAATPGDGVWATLTLTTAGAKLRVYNAAPDSGSRRCLVRHPFPLKEPVVPLQAQFRRTDNRAHALIWQRISGSLLDWFSTMF